MLYEVITTSILGSKLAGDVLAVDDVSFQVNAGECLGLVGESGCGKTTAAKLVLRSIAPDRGEIVFNDHGTLRDVLALKGDALFDYRRKVQFVFQDPFGSLNPRMTALDIVAEPLVIHKIGDSDEHFERVKELMLLVGLDVRFLRRYPHRITSYNVCYTKLLRCLSTGASAIPELIEHERTGLLVPPESVDAFAQALEALMRDPQRRRRLGAAGQARVRERFRLEANLDRLAAKFGLSAQRSAQPAETAELARSAES